MVTVRFLQDFRGRLTGERFFGAGDEAEFSESAASAMIDQGVAALVPAQKQATGPTENKLAAPASQNKRKGEGE